MDPLTHALTGAAVADALPFGKNLGAKGLVFGMLLGMAPDIDVVFSMIKNYTPNVPFTYTMFDFEMHRTYTHAFPIMAAAAPVLACLGWLAAGRSGRWAQWTLLAVLALFSHTLLDMTNGWGVRIWLPFSRERVAWGIAHIVDPLSLGILAICFLCNHSLYAGRKGRHTTLNAIGATSGWLDRNIAPRISSANLARLALAALTLRFVAGAVIKTL